MDRRNQSATMHCSEENFPEASVPYELSKAEIDLLYDEREALIRKLEQDTGLAA